MKAVILPASFRVRSKDMAFMPWNLSATASQRIEDGPRRGLS